jgi:hypothetical protein
VGGAGHAGVVRAEEWTGHTVVCAATKAKAMTFFGNCIRAECDAVGGALRCCHSVDLPAKIMAKSNEIYQCPKVNRRDTKIRIGTN